VRNVGVVAQRRSAVVVVLLVLVAGVVTVAVSARSSHASSRPNVVVIEVDDMRSSEMQYMTQTLALLQGTTFSQSYVSTSMCCPSRAAFLSGQYTQNNLVTNNSAYRKFNHANTVATWLHGSGYFTSIIGKYLNGYGCATTLPPGWDHWQALCASIYNMYGYSLRDGTTTVKYGSTAADYQTDVLAQRSVATIDEASSSGKPFFLWITPTAPHSGPGPRVAPRYATAMSNWTLPTPPSFNEANVSDKPAWVQALKPITASQKSSLRTDELRRIRMLLAADDLVAQVVNELTATGQIDNTVIMFTSDNGFMRGEHRVRTGKEVEFQESLSVPLLISGPGFPVGTNNNPVMNTDLAPTIAALAGVTPGRVQDGRSILPVVQGVADWSRRAIRHFVTPDNTSDGGTPPHPSADGIRAGPYTYFELSTGERELYDHSADPYELTNVFGQPKYSSLQSQLQQMLRVLKTCAGASCQMYLGNIAPTAAATVACTNLTCNFDASGSGDLDGTIASYDWDFGDGTTGSGVTASHTYAAASTYTATLTVTDDQGATATDAVVATGTAANLPPTAAFTSACPDLSCSFDGGASSDPDGVIAAYKWDFGDGTMSTVAAPSHDYAAAGTYTVALQVTDNRGATDTATATVSVTAPNVPPTAQFTSSCTGLDCTFDATSSIDPDGTIVSYAWDFGDGSTGSGTTPAHSYAFAGVYSVVLTVTDDRGATGTWVVPLTVG
jgi:N-acetylglucosamine-6-sulfatase